MDLYFCATLQRETTFEVSYVLPCATNPSKKWSSLKRICSYRSKFFPSRAELHWEGRQKLSWNCTHTPKGWFSFIWSSGHRNNSGTVSILLFQKRIFVENYLVTNLRQPINFRWHKKAETGKMVIMALNHLPEPKSTLF